MDYECYHHSDIVREMDGAGLSWRSVKFGISAERTL